MSEAYHIYERFIPHHTLQTPTGAVWLWQEDRRGQSAPFRSQEKEHIQLTYAFSRFFRILFLDPPHSPPPHVHGVRVMSCVWMRLHVTYVQGGGFLPSFADHLIYYREKGGLGEGGGTGGRRRLWCRLPARYRDMTHWYVWHALSTWVTWPICI